MTVLVTGATGFLGRRVVEKLLNHNYQVRCLVHSPGRERIFDHLSVDVCYGDVNYPEALELACQGVQQVVHLVAVIRETRNGTYERINVQGTAGVVAAAKESGTVSHLVHVSVIGAAPDPELAYLRSKWQAEQEVIGSGLGYTIIRPSLIFGPGDEFTTALASLVRLSPLVPVVSSGRNRLQPIWVDDLAQCIALAVGRNELMGHTLELGGPEQLSYNQIVDEVARAMGKRRMKLHLPLGLMRLNVAAMQKFVSRPPITDEMLKMLRVRNVAELGMVEESFGFTPRPMAGNIGYVNDVSMRDAVKINMGNIPPHIRDH